MGSLLKLAAGAFIAFYLLREVQARQLITNLFDLQILNAAQKEADGIALDQPGDNSIPL